MTYQLKKILFDFGFSLNSEMCIDLNVCVLILLVCVCVVNLGLTIWGYREFSKPFIKGACGNTLATLLLLKHSFGSKVCLLWFVVGVWFLYNKVECTFSSIPKANHLTESDRQSETQRVRLGVLT